jgi:hypothetical protein
MKFERRNMCIGHCDFEKSCEVGPAPRDERKVFKFSSKKLPDVET